MRRMRGMRVAAYRTEGACAGRGGETQDDARDAGDAAKERGLAGRGARGSRVSWAVGGTILHE